MGASNLASIVKGELGSQGYVVDVSARREGDIVVGKVHVTSAETEETVARLVGAGNVDDLRLCFGVDAEGTIRDALVKLLGAWEGIQDMMPPFVVKPKA